MKWLIAPLLIIIIFVLISFADLFTVRHKAGIFKVNFWEKRQEDRLINSGSIVD